MNNFVLLSLHYWFSSVGEGKGFPLNILLTLSVEESSEVVLFTSQLGAWHPGTRGSNLQETAKKLPRGSSLESSLLVEPCLCRLKSPRGSSRLVDPCSRRQELDAKRLEPAWAQGTPGLESARLVHNTILKRRSRDLSSPRQHILEYDT